MTLNVKHAFADLPSVLKLVHEQAVDLLVIQEGHPGFLAELGDGVQERLLYSVQPHATAIWSRWPLSDLRLADGTEDRPVQVMLQVPGAVPVTVTGVHTLSPGPTRVWGWRRDFGHLTLAAQQTPGSQLMLGDFNASRDHAPYRRLVRTGFVDAADAVGMLPWRAFTWPTDRPPLPLSVRIDHVLVTPQSIKVRAVQVIEVPDTDHCSVIADLEFQAV